MSEEGCWVSDFSRDELVCECNHMTDFIAFVEASYSPLFESNYIAFTVLPTLTWEALQSNTGFIIGLVYFAIFLVFLLIVKRSDMHSSKQIKITLLLKELEVPHTSKYAPEPREQTTFENEEQLEEIECQSQVSSIVAANSTQEINQNPIKDSYFPQKQKPPSKNKCSRFTLKMHSKLNTTFIAAKREKRCRCCFLFSQLIHVQLKTNNQIYQLFCSSSVITPRSIRLALFFFSILTELSISALFYDLSPSSSSEDSGSSVDQLLLNFWSGLYSLLFSLIFMSLIGWSLSLPSKWQSKLMKASQASTLQNEIKQLLKALKIRLAVAGVFFVLLSSFLCLYLVGFSELASRESVRGWLVSSLIAIVIDMTAFQFVPAIVFSLLGVLVLVCKLKCLMCGVVYLQLYRATRNVVNT